MAKGTVSEREASAGLQSTRPFECSWEDCPKSFNRKSDLQRHFRIHTNERPYFCTYAGCSKTFIQRSALTVHNRTHTGEKPHRCKHDGCGKKFSDSSSLARHRRIHSGERNYVCDVPDCRKEFCRKTTLTKHAKKHPVEGSSMIDDVMEDSGEDDWDSEPEDSPQDSFAAPQSRPSSCFGNHWPLPAETVQQRQYPPHLNSKIARRLEASIDSIKLERSSSSSPTADRPMSDAITSYQYIPSSGSMSRKPPPLRTSMAQEYRSIPMDHQYSTDTSVDTYHSPHHMTSPSSYAPFSPVASDIRQQPLYISHQRCNTYPQPRVHDINLDDAMSTSQHSNAGTPSLSNFPHGAEPLSAQSSQFSIGPQTIQDQLQAFSSPVSMHPQHYPDAQAGLIEDLRYQMPITSYPAYGTPMPDWYPNIKPEETWPGYSLPSDRFHEV